MALTDNPLFLRIASAVVLAPLVLYVLIFGELSFIAMIVFGIVLSLYEWVRMARLMSHVWLRGILGSAYIIICFVSYLAVWVSFGSGAALALILCIWASDTGAYFTGRTFKGPKLAPAISPSKTWSGLAGGLIASGLAMFAYSFWIGPWLTSAMGIGGINNGTMNVFSGQEGWLVFLIGASITITGQIGDLIESYQKRKAGLKDSGNIIPGHGGILDRIDSLLFASPVFFLTMWALHV